MKYVVSLFLLSAPLFANPEYECYHYLRWTICENEFVICKVDREIGMTSLTCESKDELLREADMETLENLNVN